MSTTRKQNISSFRVKHIDMQHILEYGYASRKVFENSPWGKIISQPLYPMSFDTEWNILQTCYHFVLSNSEAYKAIPI